MTWSASPRPPLRRREHVPGTRSLCGPPTQPAVPGVPPSALRALPPRFPSPHAWAHSRPHPPLTQCAWQPSLRNGRDGGLVGGLVGALTLKIEPAADTLSPSPLLASKSGRSSSPPTSNDGCGAAADLSTLSRKVDGGRRLAVHRDCDFAVLLSAARLREDVSRLDATVGCECTPRPIQSSSAPSERTK